MFKLKYEEIEEGYGYIHIIVNEQDISEYVYKGNQFCCICRISSILEWINTNLKYIFSDDIFPVKTNGKIGADMWLCSDNYIPENFEDSVIFHEKRQNWLWHHSIDTCRDEFCMPFVVFQKINNNMEISWNNIAHGYNGVDFRCKYGVYYLSLDEFKTEIYNFIKCYS